jgi:hypothetical protein
MKPTARVRHPAPAPDLAERLRAIVGEVTSNVTEQLVTALDELLPSLVRERLELVLDGLTGTPAEPARRARPAPAEPSGAKVPTCSSCGERGHNKRTCGREEAVSTDDADADADDAPVVEVKPPPSSFTPSHRRLRAPRPPRPLLRDPGSRERTSRHRGGRSKRIGVTRRSSWGCSPSCERPTEVLS